MKIIKILLPFIMLIQFKMSLADITKCPEADEVILKSRKLEQAKPLEAAKILRLATYKFKFECLSMRALMELGELRKRVMSKTYPEITPDDLKASSTPAFPDSYGEIFWRKKKFDKVVPSLILESQFLSPSAQITSWTAYLYGLKDVVDRHSPLILKFYKEMAAEEGASRFQFYHGMIYFAGFGVPEDVKLAEKLFTTSNLSEAKTQLGLLYYIIKDEKARAAELWHGVEDSDSESAYYLGMYYRDEKKDSTKAVKYFRKRLASYPDDAKALIQIGFILSKDPKTREEGIKHLSVQCEKSKKMLSTDPNKRILNSTCEFLEKKYYL